MSFDYKYYLETYPDLRHLNNTEAYQHWLNYGINEGRRCCDEIINYDIAITITIHLFNEKLFNEFLVYINNVKKVFT